ncbi:uncharacterized protein [Miscanthus floridulus]|uniref:uncharacterized protein n=1 Tax=Miscanthus floridulus TaxID=154761 RepID=UPI0034588AA7
MASAAMLRSAARSLRLRKPLERERCLLARRFLSSSSVLTERHTCSPSNKPLKGIMEQKSHVNEKPENIYPENIYKRLLMKVDKISEGLDEHSRLLKELEAEIKENNKHGGAIDLTPWVVSISSCLLFFGLYKYV